MQDLSNISGAVSPCLQSRFKRQCEVSQNHTNYQVMMVNATAVGIIEVEDSAYFLHPVSCKAVDSMSL